MALREIKEEMALRAIESPARIEHQGRQKVAYFRAVNSRAISIVVAGVLSPLSIGTVMDGLTALQDVTRTGLTLARDLRRP